MQSGPAKTSPGNSLCGFDVVEWVDVNSQRWYVGLLGEVNSPTDLKHASVKIYGRQVCDGLS